MPAITELPQVCVVLREIAGGVTSMMSRWVERSSDVAQTSLLLLRDTSRPFNDLDGWGSRITRRITFDGRLDNRRLLYERIAAAIPSAEVRLVANDITELGMISAVGLTNPVAFALHGDYDFYYDLAVHHADWIGSFLCVSQRIRGKLSELLPERQGDIHLTYPIVPEAVAARPGKRADMPLRLLFVGRLTEDKGFFDLPRIDSALSNTGIRLRWTVIAPTSAELELSAANWLVQPHVDHRAFVPLNEMESVYLTHDILVFPSRYEGFPMAVLESMKCGMVPVVMRLEGGISEMIRHGITGLIVDSGDWQAMASCIVGLASEPSRLTAIGTASRLYSEARFDSREATNCLSAGILAAHRRPNCKRPGPTYLSRLDRAWLPNSFVRLGRQLAMRGSGKGGR